MTKNEIITDITANDVNKMSTTKTLMYEHQIGRKALETTIPAFWKALVLVICHCTGVKTIETHSNIVKCRCSTQPVASWTSYLLIRPTSTEGIWCQNLEIFRNSWSSSLRQTLQSSLYMGAMTTFAQWVEKVRPRRIGTYQAPRTPSTIGHLSAKTKHWLNTTLWKNMLINRDQSG